MTGSEKLINRLRDELDISLSDDAVIKRTYAGRNLKAAGAFVWQIYDPKHPVREIGSQYTVTELLKFKKLDVCFVWNDWAIVSAEDE